MKLATTLTVLFTFFVGSHGWLLDRSCHPYWDMLVEAMQSAFRLAEAGFDALNQLSQPSDGPTAVAQRDLLSYLFAEAMTNCEIETSNERWQDITSTFLAVLNFLTTPDGGAEQNDGMHDFRETGDLIMYCDYGRFQENKDCEGNPKPGWACDTSVDHVLEIKGIYSDCKKTGRFPGNRVEVNTAPDSRYRKAEAHVDLGMGERVGFYSG
ncbi:hypothetical protein HFD88_007394 [Aspergillus terreus]|nr:hypothetical protein HFD88_007394 [Aspergillus terreus]